MRITANNSGELWRLDADAGVAKYSNNGSKTMNMKGAIGESDNKWNL
jgi:hypothetical protein